MDLQSQMRNDTLQELITRLDKLEHIIDQSDFRQPTGRANEVNHWVFDYPPNLEKTVRSRLSSMRKKAAKGAYDFQLIIFDLYEIMIDFLEKNDYITPTVELEKEYGFEAVRNAIQEALEIQERNNKIIEKLIENTQDNSIILITGIGKCFPILGAGEVFDKILYNMPRSFDKLPIVLFYPGTYTEQELIVFNEYKEKDHYRAFRIVR